MKLIAASESKLGKVVDTFPNSVSVTGEYFFIFNSYPYTTTIIWKM